MKRFFDWESENLASNIPRNGARCLLDLSNIKIAQGYVTLKILNRENRYVNVNIQPGKPGIVLQESLFNKYKEYKVVYLVSETNDHTRFIRVLPVEGFSDWLLIYNDTLFIEVVKENISEIELIAV